MSRRTWYKCQWHNAFGRLTPSLQNSFRIRTTQAKIDIKTISVWVIFLALEGPRNLLLAFY